MERSVDVESWTLTPDEQSLIAGKRAANRLDVAVLLKYFQQHTRFPASTLATDPTAVTLLAEQLGLDPVLQTLTGRTLERVRSEIRRFYGYREATVHDARHLTTWLCDNAVAHTRNHNQLIEALENECRKRRLEPPTLDRLERIARSAVRAYEERFYAQTLARLSPLTRTRLDELLESTNEQGDDVADQPQARLIVLRRDAGRASVKSLRDEMAKIDIIRNLQLPADLFDHALPHELELYRSRVAVEAPFELRRHPEPARLTRLAAFAFLRGRAITDTLVDLLVETIHHINARAERRVEHELLEDLKRITGKQNMLFHLADAALAHPDGIIREVVYPIVSESTLRALVKEWKATGPTYRTTLRTFIRNSYKSHYRQMVPQLLQTLEFRSNNEMHRPVIRGVELLKQYAGTRTQMYPADEDVPLDFVRGLWRDAVVETD